MRVFNIIKALLSGFSSRELSGMGYGDGELQEAFRILRYLEKCFENKGGRLLV